MLKMSEKDFPEDYNPPARLALAYEAMKDYEMALASSDKALSQGVRPPPGRSARGARAHQSGEG